MKNFTTLRLGGEDLRLDELTTMVQQGEEQDGPLLAISPCERIPPYRLTFFTHELTSAPDKPIELRLCPNGNIPTIPGKTLVCIGDCFVESEIQVVAAFR